MWNIEMWNITNTIINTIVNTIINPVPLFEWLVISDSICSSINFVNKYITFKRDNVDKRNDIAKRKDDIIKSYNNLYKIELSDRYILYLCLYINYLLLTTFFERWSSDIIIMKYIIYTKCTILTLPYIQNKLLEINCVNNIITEFRNDKIRFMKYTISKITIKCIKELDISIVGIKNYHIFILYNYISFSFLLEFIKCYILIYLLYFLRNSSNTYYYYKAIKIAYYYNTNYLFNIITRDEAIFNINNIIKEKRWKELSNIENVHSLYTLFQYKFNGKDNRSDIYINIIGFFTLWSFICIIKVINYILSIILLSCYIVINIYNNKVFLKDNYKKIFTSFFVYFMIFLGINDLVITLVCINYKILYYVWNEIYFYIENKRDIKKVLMHYKLKSN